MPTVNQFIGRINTTTYSTDSVLSHHASGLQTKLDANHQQTLTYDQIYGMVAAIHTRYNTPTVREDHNDPALRVDNTLDTLKIIREIYNNNLIRNRLWNAANSIPNLLLVLNNNIADLEEVRRIAIAGTPVHAQVLPVFMLPVRAVLPAAPPIIPAAAPVVALPARPPVPASPPSSPPPLVDDMPSPPPVRPAPADNSAAIIAALRAELARERDARALNNATVFGAAAAANRKEREAQSAIRERDAAIARVTAAEARLADMAARMADMEAEMVRLRAAAARPVAPPPPPRVIFRDLPPAPPLAPVLTPAQILENEARQIILDATAGRRVAIDRLSLAREIDRLGGTITVAEHIADRDSHVFLRQACPDKGDAIINAFRKTR